MRSRTWAETEMSAPPALIALRLAKLPLPGGELAVSTSSVRTSSNGTPRCSATICEKVVPTPCPIAGQLVHTDTVPSSFRATRPAS
jgi:hypothetical protein